jgi:tetratricopeptide (TPR) repeat protein
LLPFPKIGDKHPWIIDRFNAALRNAGIIMFLMRKLLQTARWLGVIGLFSLYLFHPIQWNQWSLLAYRGIFQNPILLSSAAEKFHDLQVSGCRQEFWWPGLIASLQDQLPDQRVNWLGYLECTQYSISFLKFSLPDDTVFMQTAQRLYPNDPNISIWRYNFLHKIQINNAISLLSNFAKANPPQGEVACRLGSLYTAKQQFNLAVPAFLACCKNGNPNREGCLNAGLLMESLGDSQKAIEYYRLSAWDFDLKRADELERKLLP